MKILISTAWKAKVFMCITALKHRNWNALDLFTYCCNFFQGDVMTSLNNGHATGTNSLEVPHS